MTSGWNNSSRRATAWRAWRALLLGAVTAIAIVNVIATARRVPPPPRLAPGEPPDVVLRYEARFAPVRRVLAEQGVRGTIGFVGGEPARAGAEPDATLDYLLTQYALAPWVLERNPVPHVWLVANPRASRLPHDVGDDFKLVHDFGGGLRLLRREP